MTDELQRLRAENEKLKLDVKHQIESKMANINAMQAFSAKYESLRADNASLRQDALRLDWLFSELDNEKICTKIGLVADMHAMGSWLPKPFVSGDFRAAIDAAMQEKKP